MDELVADREGIKRRQATVKVADQQSIPLPGNHRISQPNNKSSEKKKHKTKGTKKDDQV